MEMIIFLNGVATSGKTSIINELQKLSPFPIMSTEIALSQDELAIMKADREKMGSKFPTVPQIRLSNTDMEQAPNGEYFIQKGYGENVEIIPIGKMPEIVIIYRTYTYSYSTKEDGLIAWTSDIHGFGPMDDVTLFKKINGKVEIDFDGSYAEFKNHAKKHYTMIDPVTQKEKKLLKFKTVLYVTYNGEVHKMFVTNASSSGVDSEGNLSFDKPQEGSLQVFFDNLWKDKRISYEYKLMLGSKYIKSSKPYYIMTFGVMGEQSVDDLRVSIRMSQQAQKAIVMIDSARKNYNKKEGTEEPIISYESEIKPEDLPF